MLRTLIKTILLLPYKFTRVFDKYYGYFLSSVLTSEFASEGRTSYIALNSEIKNTVKHRCINGTLFEGTFFTPNRICSYRVNTFSSKEPEMLAWVDRFGGKGALFDIGANIGLYSIYYAKTQPGPVYAFEPSVFNQAQLVKNVCVNNVEDKISIVSNPLSDSNSFASFNVSSTDEGSAINAFGIDYGPDGESFSSVLRYNVMGFSLDYLLSSKIINDVPAMIKIDVDGIEHLILSGAKTTLRNNESKTVFVEVNDSFESQANGVRLVLMECGFHMLEKIDSGRQSCNQVWTK